MRGLQTGEEAEGARGSSQDGRRKGKQIVNVTNRNKSTLPLTLCDVKLESHGTRESAFMAAGEEQSGDHIRAQNYKRK